MDKIQIINSETVSSFIQRHYPTYDSEVDDRPISEILDEINRKLRQHV